MSKVLVIQDEDISYIGDIGERNIKLRFSNSEVWNSSTKGTKIGELKDTGDGINIKIDDLKIKLDYDGFSQLYALMSLKVAFDENLMEEMKFIEL